MNELHANILEFLDNLPNDFDIMIWQLELVPNLMTGKPETFGSFINMKRHGGFK